jgi:sigma-E factor negative regulatory protein RseC
MIETTARVVTAENGKVLIAAESQSSCGGCQSRSVCGISGLGKYFSNTRKAIEVKCDANVRVGDKLQLSMDEGDLLKAGLLAYLLPSVLALVGAAIATRWGDAAAVLGAATGFATGFLIGRLSGWVPQIIAQRKNEL